ncbi:DNA cytosine methyltransferase [Roseibium album]|uniref:DNA cytosine methyltransferase n=1 Tax=Roseibium album TaxID=311410 RepID=UPI002492E158|nr:DNA cytosine methyltransferase [Roseibium album]
MSFSARSSIASFVCEAVPRKLRVLDLFSGIGGFSLGLERTGGFETVAFCEIEPRTTRVVISMARGSVAMSCIGQKGVPSHKKWPA